MKKDRLKGKMKERRLSYFKCAKKLDMSVTTLSNKINGNSKFYLDEVERLSILLNLSIDEKVDIFLN